MLLFKKHVGSGTVHGSRAGRAVSAAHRPVARPDDLGNVWRPAKQLADASAIVAAVVVLATAPTAHALTDATPALRPAAETSVAQHPACGAATPANPANPLAELSAGLFGGGTDVPDQRDPITPFTLYGTSFKKYLIEQLQGEKIVSRKKGFTVNACVGAVEVTKETPQFQMLPTGDKALYAKDRVCRKAEGQELKETCRSACEAACSDTLDAYAQQVRSESGFALLGSDKARLAKSCSRNCSYECVKPGKAFDFVIPYRR